MTATELIEDLMKLDGDTLILLSSDGEGNSYSPIDSYSTGILCDPDNEYETHDKDDVDDDPDFRNRLKECIVLYPA